MSKRPLCMRDVIADLCHRWGIEKKVKEYSVLSQWSQVVGERISEKAIPTGIERGKLFVQVESSSWRNELMFIKREIIDKLNQAVGAKVIRDIIFSARKGAKQAR